MLVQSFLAQGAAAAVASRLSSFPPVDALVLFSLGVDHAALVKAVVESPNTPDTVYLTETYGILGFDEDLGKNIELMEKDRGSEYGFVGGSGGQGCLVVGFSGEIAAGHTEPPPETATNCMVVADQSGAWAKVQSKAPVQYGGITKNCWKVCKDAILEEVPYFWIADTSTVPVGVATFTDDAQVATESLLKKLPRGVSATGSVGLFPCYTRGINHYGTEHVEPTAIASALPDARVYGMFAHGELGPESFGGYVSSPNNIPCKKHSMTTILSVHTKQNT